MNCVKLQKVLLKPLLIDSSFLLKDLLSTLAFTDSAKGVLFIDTETNSVFPVKDYEFSEDPYLAAQDATAIAVVTEWDLYKNLDYERIFRSMKKISALIFFS